MTLPDEVDEVPPAPQVTLASSAREYIYGSEAVTSDRFPPSSAWSS